MTLICMTSNFSRGTGMRNARKIRIILKSLKINVFLIFISLLSICPVFQPKIEHLDLIEGVVVDLLKTKWKSFIKRTFFRQLMIYCFYFALSMFCFVSRPHPQKFECVPLLEEGGTTDVGNLTFGLNSTELPFPFDSTETTTLSSDLFEEDSFTTAIFNATFFNDTLGIDPGLQDEGDDEEDEAECEDGFAPEFRDKCIRNEYDTIMKQLRLIAEIGLIFWSISYWVIAIREFTFLPTKIFLQNLALCPSRCFFLIGCAFLVGIVPLRASCEFEGEDSLAVFAMLFTSCYFLYFGR